MTDSSKKMGELLGRPIRSDLQNLSKDTSSKASSSAGTSKITMGDYLQIVRKPVGANLERMSKLDQINSTPANRSGVDSLSFLSKTLDSVVPISSQPTNKEDLDTIQEESSTPSFR